MVERTRLERVESLSVPNVNTGRAESLNTLSARLREFSANRSRAADIETEQMAMQKGAIESAGKLTSDLPDGTTIADRAYRSAALKGHAAAIKNHISAKNAELQLKYPLDSVGYKQEFDGFKQGLLKGVDPLLHPLAIPELDDAFNRGGQNILANERKVEIDQIRADSTEAIENSFIEAEKYALEGNLEKAAEQEVAAAFFWDDPLAFTPEQQRVLKDKFSDAIDFYLVRGEFDRSNNKIGFLKNFRKTQKGTEDLTVAQIDKLTAYMDSAVRKIEAEQAAVVANMRGQAKDYLTMLERGDIAPSDMTTFLSQYATTAPAEAAAFEAMVRQQEYVNNYQGLRPEVIKQAADQIDRTNIAGSDLGARFDKLIEESAKNMTPDAVVEWAAENGKIELSPVTVFSADEIRERTLQSNVVGNEYGIRSPNPFTQNEIASLSRAYNNANQAGKLSIAANVVDGAGDNSVQIFESMGLKGDVNMAFVGKAWMDKKYDLADILMTGQELSNDKNYLDNTAEKDMNSLINDRLLELYPMSTQTEYRQALASQAGAAYKGLTHRGGFSRVAADDKVVDMAISMLVNPPDTVWGNTTPMLEGLSGRQIESEISRRIMLGELRIPGQSADFTRDMFDSGRYRLVENAGVYNILDKRAASYGEAFGLVLGEDNKPVVIDFFPEEGLPYLNQQKERMGEGLLEDLEEFLADPQ